METQLPTEEPAKVSDLGTPELQRRGVTVLMNINTRQLVAKVRTQRPIDYYLNRGYIEDYHFHAAAELDRDYYISKLDAPLRSSLDIRIGSCTDALQDYQEDCYRRYLECMGLLDKQEKALITRVIFDDAYLKDVKEEWKGFGMLTPLTAEILCEALEKVAKFYGVKS